MLGSWFVDCRTEDTSTRASLQECSELDSEEYRTVAPQAIAAAKSSCDSSNESSSNSKHQVIHQAGF